MQWLHNMSIKQTLPKSKTYCRKKDFKEKVYISIIEFHLTQKNQNDHPQKEIIYNGHSWRIYTLRSTYPSNPL